MKYVGENLSNNRRDFSHDRNLRPRDSHFGLDLEYTLFLLNMLFLEFLTQFPTLKPWSESSK